MEMEDHQQRKFVCKWCYKCYPCGKSLGGHIKAHRIQNSVENVPSFDGEKSYNVESHVEISGNSSYKLRENRRMSLKAVELIDDDEGFPLFQEEHVCKQCGKGFQTLKALSGHMACHSEKDRGFKDDYSWIKDFEKLETDSLSDTESEEIKAKNKRRPNAAFKSFSSPVSEIDDQDQEEVAMCLMMLSKDSSNWGGVNSVVESSDNQSDVLETKSSSAETKITRNPVFVKDPTLEANKRDSKAEAFVQESSDSGYYLDECVEKGESDTSFDGFFKNAAVYEANNKWPNVIEPKNKKRPKRHAYPDTKVVSKQAPKKTKYECLNCKKTFSSYQGLGGHRPCNKKPNSCYEEKRCENGENSLEPDATDSDENNMKIIRECLSKKKVEKNPKKNKIHECPFCNRIFKNGQALGGHKRSHFLGSGGVQVEATNRARFVKTTTQSELLDLNLPAPTEEDEANDDDDDDDDDDGDFVRDTRFLASIDE